MKYLTLMIIPYPGAEVRSIRIRHSTLRAVAVLAVLLFSVGLAGAIYLRPVMHKAREYDRLQAENQLLTLEKQKIKELSGKIEDIDRLVEKIQIAQGAKHSGVSAEDSLAAAANNEAAMKEMYPLASSGSRYNPTEAQDSRDSKIPYGIPVDEKSYISRLFNPDIYHFGIDIALKQGTPVRTTADGVVTNAKKDEDLGFYVMIKHGNGFSTLYAHNSRLAVKTGDRVRRGDLIAYSGNLGLSSGPHLHYAIFDQNGNPIDPLPYLEP
ncbi:MAG: M23 family metallopeptidase [Candidatus Glassbacteria bacterium]